MIALAAAVSLCISLPGNLRADDADLYSADVNPHVLIILDMSTSMSWDISGHTTDYENSRFRYAKDAIRAILDANRDGSITNADKDTLKIDFGYMKYKTCNRDYISECITVPAEIGSSYSEIWDRIKNDTIPGLPIGYTPLASSLDAAKNYFTNYSNSGKACAKKFVILVTDGNDTLSCSPDFFASETKKDQYKRRRASVQAAKALKDAGIPVFVLGFAGDLIDLQEYTLNWMAYFGGTDNLTLTNSPDPPGTIYTPVANPCSGGTTINVDIVPGEANGCDGGHMKCFAKGNDPGNISLRGYAYLTADVMSLTTALRQVLGTIRSGNYSFTQPSVPSVQLSDEDKSVYAASFEPNTESFWPGHLQKFEISSNLTIGNALLDAGQVLQIRTASRNIYTWKTDQTTGLGGMVAFTTSNMASSLLGNPTSVEAVVGYIRGEDADYNPHSGKRLGDIYHSSPALVGLPSPFFIDFLDKNINTDGRRGFDLFRESCSAVGAPRNGTKYIFAGSNHGQLHAFKTSDMSEVWSFIPPNFLGRLKDVQHADPAPSSVVHRFFVDGPISVADIWIPVSSNGSGGASKSASEWHTYLVFGEGRGGEEALWSSSVNCDTGFSTTYSSTYAYYCGYYALDVTDPTANPQLKWILHPSAGDAPYFGSPRGKVAIGRVVDSGNETWVGFLGGGYNGGKGFFTVKMSDGSILWRKMGTNGPAYDLVATPLLIDTDNDGFIDRAYAADLGGNIWRFKLCKKTDVSGCSITDNWSGSIFFQGSANEKIFTSLTAARDPKGNLWIYWGTGNKLNPLEKISDYQDKVYAVRDNDSDTGLTRDTNLGTISQFNSAPSSYKGWYFALPDSGEKMISDPVVFKEVLYFTSYVPPATGSDVCNQVGYSYLYALSYLTGVGSFNNSALRTNIGTGLASSIVISTDGKGKDFGIYSRTGGQGKPDAPISLPSSGSSMTKIMYWRDNRLFKP